MMARPFIREGARVRTNYGTGPYIVHSISGPCACPAYLRSINGDHRPSPPHFHFVVRPDNDARARDSYLNGFTLDGRSVWSKDRVLDASQMDLFS
ncbi:hypothetical protein [Cupriavidus pauculus]|uniref:hypothetical protein n=1 Tax=Cupriavidus pauculus TaxID=82633 RepID=UPI001D0C1B2B|nr:hypothetical protein [Cupriavidus pauculus]